MNPRKRWMEAPVRGVRALLMLGMMPMLASTAVQAAEPPGARFDLSDYKLQLPVKRRDSVVELGQPELARYASDYFYLDADQGTMVFACPDNGASTRGSHYPRSELRSLREWTFDGQHSLSARLAVLREPGSGDIIVGQIHGDGKGSEALKIRWVRGDIVVGVKSTRDSRELRRTLVKGVALGQFFDYAIEQQGREVRVSVNGQSASFSYDDSWNGSSVYFKAGNYLQDNSGAGTLGVVAFQSLHSD